MTTPTLFTETWEQKALRLAQEVRSAAEAMDSDCTKVTRKQRERWQQAKYAMQLHVRAVPA